MIKNNFEFWNNRDLINKRQEINIILLAHVHAPRGTINHNQIQCSSTERFSIDEFNEIYQGIVNAGYYIQAVYFNELDFISEYIQNPKRFDNSLVYNLARNGFGNNKKTIIPSFCELVGLKYTTSTAVTCSLCRDKYLFSTLLKSHDIPTPDSWLFNQDSIWLPQEPHINTQIIVKPCSESASQGVNEKCIIASRDIGKYIHKNSIVQEFINGIECEVPVFKIGQKIQAFPPVGIDLKGRQIIDEKSSNEYSYDFYDLCATQSIEVISRLRNLAEQTFRVLQMEVYGRVDFRIDQEGNPYVFDVSTTPYTIHHSSFAFAFDRLGFEYNNIYNAIISAALMRY